MEDNKELNKNGELDDDQVEDVSGGVVFIRPQRKICQNCHELREMDHFYPNLCKKCADEIYPDGRTGMYVP